MSLLGRRKGRAVGAGVDIPKQIKGKPFLLQGGTGKVICPDTGLGAGVGIGREREVSEGQNCKGLGYPPALRGIRMIGHMFLGFFSSSNYSGMGPNGDVCINPRLGTFSMDPGEKHDPVGLSVIQEMFFIFFNFN